MEQLSLLELNEIIKATLDTHLEPSYWVVAEIGEMRINQRGHCYMELVEKEDEDLIAKIRANIWAYTYRNLAGWFEATTGESLKRGMKILANVMVQFHEIYGISLIVRDIDPNFTLGERARKRQEVIIKLRENHLLDKNKAHSLPIVPQRLAVISSPTAAGWGDFQEQLFHNQRGYTFHLRLFKSLMQGEEAVENIIQALERIELTRDKFDLVIIIRGGGSQVDLDCFDSYLLCSRIAEMPLPVITGIGHERDETIADMVAHTSLKTPTAVSEFLISQILNYESGLSELAERIRKASSLILRFEELHLNEQLSRVKQVFHLALKNKSHNLLNLQKSLMTATRFNLNNKQKYLENMTTRLSLLDPEQVLKRGYTITSLNNKFITHAENVGTGDKLRTYTDKLKIDSVVEKSESR